MRIDRRNQTALGRKRRREFERSVKKLRDLGMPEWAVEFYRRTARVAGLPPHMVVSHVAVVAAGRQMRAGAREPMDADEPAADGAASGSEDVSYQTIRSMRQRVSSLLQDIQRHGTLADAEDGEDATPEAQSKLAVLQAAIAASRKTDPPRSKRRGKSSTEGH